MTDNKDFKGIYKIHEKGFDTAAIHSGERYNSETGAIVAPIYMTSTFEYGNPGGFDYTRSGNPNFKNLENTLADLEHSSFCTVFGSGVSAITAVVSSLESGDSILLEENVYGCTYRLLERVFKKFGVTSYYCDFSNKENWKKIEEIKPTLVWLESPTNPLLKILDIAAISESAHKVGSLVVVDNTFASSFIQKPLKLGADLSLSSTTKYIGGHSDSLGGAVCTNLPEWQEKLIFAQKALGLHPSPFDSWLIQRGVKTLSLRMERHSANALKIAKYFENETSAKCVRYPFLESHPQYALAKKQMTLGSGIITVDLGLSLDETEKFIAKLKYFPKAESLGGVESLICHPASMTHASVPSEIKIKIGITDSLIRFSVGTENIEDLLADIKSALPSDLKNKDSQVKSL